jgi:hypothetical protein
LGLRGCGMDCLFGEWSSCFSLSVGRTVIAVTMLQVK